MLRVAVALLLVASTAAAQPAEPAPRGVTLSAIAGMSVPINGFKYNLGSGVRAGFHKGNVYVGGMLALHQGDSKSINYGPVPALGLQGGEQQYDSTPVFLVADGGYRIRIPLGALQTTFTPYISLGLLAMPMSSSGAYGDTTVTNTYLVIGGGFSYTFWFSENWGAGLHWRQYNVGDTSFEFGDLSEGTAEHGFSTSIFYSAFYGEVAYRF